MKPLAQLPNISIIALLPKSLIFLSHIIKTHHKKSRGNSSLTRTVKFFKMKRKGQLSLGNIFRPKHSTSIYVFGGARQRQEPISWHRRHLHQCQRKCTPTPSPKAALGELWKRIFSDINIDPDNYLDQFSSTSFPWSFPLLGGSPPHPQVREKAMGTRLQFFKDFFRLIRCLKIYLHRFIINTSLNPIQIEIVHD